MRDGGYVSSDGNGYIAFSTNTTGYAVVSGPGSTWSMAVNLYVGGNGAAPGGSGQLQIDTGGTVSAAATTIYNTGFLMLGGSPILDSPLTFLGGSIQMVGNTTFTNSFTLGAGGVRVYTNFFDSTFGGVISGAGGLDKPVASPSDQAHSLLLEVTPTRAAPLSPLAGF